MEVTMKEIKAKITNYESFEEFERYTNNDESDFYDRLLDGDYIDCTIGTYNGATDTFQKANLTDDVILDSIYYCMIETVNFDFLFNDFELDETATVKEQVYAFVCMNNVFILDDSIYIEFS